MRYSEIYTHEVTRKLVQSKVRQLVNTGYVAQQDRQDLEHELWLHIFKRVAAHDLERGHLNVFMRTVIERHTATLLRNRRAPKRNGRPIHLSAPLERKRKDDDDEHNVLADTISQRELDRRRQTCRISDEELVSLKAEIEEVLASLPQHEQVVARRLMYQSISDISHELDVPRTSLYTPVKRIRQAFEDAGLRIYCTDPRQK